MVGWIVILITAGVIELITLFGRFVLKIDARSFHLKFMKFLGLKKIIRVHHFFIGLLVSLIAYFFMNSFWISLGLGVALSDILHHIILRVIIGSYEVRFLYLVEKEIEDLREELIR